MEKGKGLRFNEGKVRQDLIPAWAVNEVAKVFTMGSIKYGDHNWTEGMNWSKMVASLKRHLTAFELGQDYDDESKLLHASHLATNALMLLELYRIFPEGDDRLHNYLKPKRIALDLDGVLADFGSSYKKRLKAAGIDVKDNDHQFHWEFSYKDGPVWAEVLKDKDFWVNLEPLCDSHLPFEPVCYVSSRQIPVEWSQEWLEKHGFPCEKVYHVGTVGNGSKAQTLKDAGVEVFVDDNIKNFIQLNKAGICTFLFDRPYNEKLKVGYKRIKDLEELVK